MVLRGDRTPGASGQTGAGPASQRRSLVLRGRRSAWSHLQGCARVVNRGHCVRRGSEQRTLGQPSLAGSRGGGGKRDYPCPNAGPPRLSDHSYAATFYFVGSRSAPAHGSAVRLPRRSRRSRLASGAHRTTLCSRARSARSHGTREGSSLATRKNVGKKAPRARSSARSEPRFTTFARMLVADLPFPGRAIKRARGQR